MTLIPSRKITAIFIGVFLVGVLVGGLLVNVFQDAKLARFFNSTNDPKSMAERINQKYIREDKLTPEEEARIAPITQEMTQRLRQVRQQFGVDIIATLDDYHSRIGAQMTPDHRAIFQKANDERIKRMKTMLLLDHPVLDAESK